MIRRPRDAPPNAWKELQDGYIRIEKREWRPVYCRFNSYGSSYIDLRDVLEILTKNRKKPRRMLVSLAVKGRRELLQTEMRRGELTKLLKLWMEKKNG